MSREQKLSKKIAHTLLAMSIVYSGGMNVLCNTAFAAGKGADGADKKENVTVTNSAYTDTYTGNDGADGASGRSGESGGNGGKMVLELTGSEDVVNNISFTATGGKGGVGRQDVDYNGKGPLSFSIRQNGCIFFCQSDFIGYSLLFSLLQIFFTSTRLSMLSSLIRDCGRI